MDRGVARNFLEGGVFGVFKNVGYYGCSTRKIMGCGRAKMINFVPFSA